MNDKELARAAMDLLETNCWDWNEGMNAWVENHGEDAYDEIFVLDGSVSIALMQMIHSKDLIIEAKKLCSGEALVRIFKGVAEGVSYAESESLQRAITEACVKALSTDRERQEP